MQPGLHLRLFKPKVRVRDTMDGSERAVHGPRQGFEVYCMAPERLFFLGPYERLEGAGQGVSLTSMQYVLIEAQRRSKRDKSPALPCSSKMLCCAVRILVDFR